MMKRAIVATGAERQQRIDDPFGVRQPFRPDREPDRDGDGDETDTGEAEEADPHHAHAILPHAKGVAEFMHDHGQLQQREPNPPTPTRFL